MKHLITCRFACIIALVFSSGCGSGASESASVNNGENHQIPVVVTTSYPLYAITQTIAQDDFTVEFPMAASDSPREWKPKADDIQTLQRADLLLLSSAGYEPWRAFLSLPQSRSFDTSTCYDSQLLRTDGSVTHQHGPKGVGDGSGVSWATWLTPTLLQQQLICVSGQLQKLSPYLKDKITEREKVVTQELDLLNDKVQELIAPADRTIVVLADSPFYDYLAQRLNWQVHHVDFSNDQDFDTQAESFRKAVQNLKPDLLLLRKNADLRVQSTFDDANVPVARVDFCESEQAGMSLLHRLNDNVTNLKAALNTD